MLVLTRKLGESIIIGDNIKIKIVAIKKNSVKIAVEAPEYIPVHREEVYLKIKNQNIEAAKIDLNIDLEEIIK